MCVERGQEVETTKTRERDGEREKERETDIQTDTDIDRNRHTDKYANNTKTHHRTRKKTKQNNKTGSTFVPGLSLQEPKGETTHSTWSVRPRPPGRPQPSV